MSKYKEFDLSNQKKYKMSERLSKVDIKQFAKTNIINIKPLLDSLPEILKGSDFKNLLNKTLKAYKNKKPIIVGMGGHVIKTGMSPLFIELMNKNVISAICCNGSVAIHDFEIANFGKTSEDVEIAIEDGSFGMATDTCDVINDIITNASELKLGYGEAIGKYLSEKDYNTAQNAQPELSLFKNAYENNVPVCVHIAIGTDITHQHQSANGKAIGDTSMRDFRILCNIISNMDDGGVFICFGSAVILPEVFLKALTVCRNKKEVKNFTTAVFDMNSHYRPEVNIASRPTKTSGKGYYFNGHHEIMIPLFLLSLKEMINELNEN
jgi:deoxyhypusine synthase